jgi:hypothetical protein
MASRSRAACCSAHALLRLAQHADIDLIGQRLSIPIDINVFTDRDRPGVRVLQPSELDLISGVTSTWPVGATALELGARGEADLPVDRGGYKQIDADVRARWLLSLRQLVPGISDALAGGDLTGVVTFGWFAINPSYPARPDNSGNALWRYGMHLELHYAERLFIALDATMYTDRHAQPFTPSELDLTPEIGVTIAEGLDVHLAYERDMPIDRGGVVPHFLLLFATWDFSLLQSVPGS